MDQKHHATAVDITLRWLSSSAKWNFGRFSNDVDSDFYHLLGLQFPLPSDLEEDAIRCIKERVKVEKKRVWRDTLVDMTHSDKPDVALEAGKLLAKLPAVNPKNVNNFVISGNVNSKVTFDNVNIRNDVGEGCSASKKRKTRHETPQPPQGCSPAPPPYPSGSLEDDHRLGAKGKQVGRSPRSSSVYDQEVPLLPATVDSDESDTESGNTTPQASASRLRSSSLSIDEATFFAAFDDMASQCEGCCRHNNDPDDQGCSGCCSHPPTLILSSSPSTREETPRAPTKPAADVPEISSPSPGPYCSCATALEQLKHDMREQKRQIEEQGKILQSVRKFLLLQRKADKTLTELLLNFPVSEEGSL